MADSDEIYQRYEARAIRAMNALADDIGELDDGADPNLAPVLGSGHPLADIMLVKERARPAEVLEGVAFFGRAGTAVLKSIQRMGIDPLLIYGTNCAKRIDDDLDDPKGTAAGFLLREVQITEPKIIVCMGEATAAFLHRIRIPLAEPIDPDLLGEVQPLTPTIEVLVTPDIDAALDDEAAKRRFWRSFQALGRWYEALPPY